MVISFKGKNLTEVVNKIKTITREDVNLEMKAQLETTPRDMLCLLSFYQFLKENQKSKTFLTTEDSIVWKDRNVLRKLHKVRITTIEKLEKRKLI